MKGFAVATQAKAVIYGKNIYLIPVSDTSLMLEMCSEFPWKELGDGATVCDVGGGIGDISLQLAKAYPNLRLILQDLPEQINVAKNEIWPK